MMEFEKFPESFAQRYRDEGYWRGEVLGDLLKQYSQDEPDRIAIVEPSRRWSYGELDELADKFAAYILECGILAGERIVVQLPNRAMFAIVSIGMFRAGVIPVYALPSHREHEILYLCDYAQAVGYITTDQFQGFNYHKLALTVSMRAKSIKHIFIDGKSDSFLELSDMPKLRKKLPKPDPGSVAFFLLSGGTTGMPKLIPRTHDDYSYQLRATCEVLNFDKNGSYLATISIAHNAALGCPGLLGSLYVGGKTLLPDSPSPDDAFPLIEREGASLTTLMPPLVILWLELAPDFNIDLSKLLIQVGSAHFAPELAKRVRSELGCKLTQWFGMAEGLLTGTRLDDSEEIIDYTQGRPICAADEIRVVDENDQDVPIGSVGELITRGPYTLRGYYKAPEHNAIAFTDDGFLRTGDLVSMTPEGNMIVEGRVKDVINRGGEKIVASEVEDLMLEHASIREAAIIGVPDETMGEKSCAFIVTRNNDLELRTLRAFLSEKGIAPYKLPDVIKIVQSMPRTHVGKLDKSKLREQYTAVQISNVAE